MFCEYLTWRNLKELAELANLAILSMTIIENLILNRVIDVESIKSWYTKDFYF